MSAKPRVGDRHRFVEPHHTEVEVVVKRVVVRCVVSLLFLAMRRTQGAIVIVDTGVAVVIGGSGLREQAGVAPEKENRRAGCGPQESCGEVGSWGMTDWGDLDGLWLGGLQFVARWSMTLLADVDVQKTAENPQLQFIKVVDTRVVTQRLIPMVMVTIEIHQLFFDKVIDVPVGWLCRSSTFLS